jgi:rod shape-determining protein MreC
VVVRRARRKIVDHLIAAVLLAVPVLFLSANFKNPARVNGVDRVVLAISSPIQGAVGWMVDGLAGLWHRYVWLVDVQEENDELRAENQRLRDKLAEATRQASAAAELDGLLELRERIAAPTLAARVVAVGTTPYFRVTRIVLDRGAGEVAEGMPVVAPGGVVGRIRRVYGRYADVVLAVDPQSAVDVLVPRTGSRGVLRGVGGANVYACRVEYLLRSEEVRTDDLVVTSGLGGVFPRDIPVGRVRKIAQSEYGLYQEVEVAPSVDFSHLSSVVVVLSPPPPPDPSAGKGLPTKKSPEPAFGMVPYR